MADKIKNMIFHIYIQAWILFQKMKMHNQKMSVMSYPNLSKFIEVCQLPSDNPKEEFIDLCKKLGINAGVCDNSIYVFHFRLFEGVDFKSATLKMAQLLLNLMNYENGPEEDDLLECLYMHKKYDYYDDEEDSHDGEIYGSFYIEGERAGSFMIDRDGDRDTYSYEIGPMLDLIERSMEIYFFQEKKSWRGNIISKGTDR